jgi:hypothetical protein
MGAKSKLREFNGLTEKQCTKCALWKPANSTGFASFKQGVLGLHPWCRSCLSEYSKEKYEKTRTTVRKYLQDFGQSPRLKEALPQALRDLLSEITKEIDDGAIFKAYLITNQLTGECYVGITERSLRLRWKQHLSYGVKGKGYLLHHAMHRDGIENFKFEYIACAIDRHQLHKLEIQLVKQYQSVEIGYNQTRGGAASESVGDKVDVAGKSFISRNSAARHFGIAEATVAQRMTRYGWTAEQAFGIAAPPVIEPNRRLTEVGGERYPNFNAACRANNVTESAVRARLKRGWSIEEAFGLKQAPKRIANNAKTVFLNGSTYPSLSAAAEHYSQRPGAVVRRLSVGWTLEQAFGLTPPPRRDVGGVPITIGGIKFVSLAAACEKYGGDARLVAARIRKGWSPEQAFGLLPQPERPSANGEEIEVAGKVYPSRAMAAKALNLDPRIVHKRIKTYGWTLNQAFGIDPPPVHRSNHAKRVTIGDRHFATIADACEAFGITISAVQRRIARGSTLEEALTLPSRKSVSRK